MRRLNLRFLILPTMLLCIAAEPTTQPPATQPSGMVGAFMQRLHSAVDQLQLSTEQRMRVRHVMDETSQRLQDLRRDAQNGGSQLHEKFQAIVQDMRQQLRSILTPQQQEQLRDLLSSDNAASPTTQPAEHADAPPPQITSLHVGQKAPDFVLQKLDGPSVALSSFKGKIVLLVFGSYSSPIFREHAAAVQQLRNQYVPRINPLIIYTKENYPAGDWDIERNKEQNISISQASNMDARIAAARQARDRLELSVPILLDSMDDKTASDYDAFSNAAVLIGRDGTVLFFQKWFEPYALRAAIDVALKS
jgi:Spy/CpxP family protein refolding chaperone